MSETQDEIELVIDYSKFVDKFFQNLENFYLEGQENIDIKKIKGTKLPQYRMRIGSYRVIFTVNKEIINVYYIFVEKADSRGDIYKK